MPLRPSLQTKSVILRRLILDDLNQWVIGDDEDSISHNSGLPANMSNCRADLLTLTEAWALKGFGGL